MQLWKTREDALRHLETSHPSRLAVANRLFELADACLAAYEGAPQPGPYSIACTLALLKAKNYALGVYSLILDGLAQEAGALVRPMIEYGEILTYLRQNPDMADRALDGNLPNAGKRAKAIGGIYQGYRDHLSENASHAAFSLVSVRHLFGHAEQGAPLRKSQPMVPGTLEQNLQDFVVLFQLLLHEAVLSLEPTGSPELEEIAIRWERLKHRLLDVFVLPPPSPGSDAGATKDRL